MDPLLRKALGIAGDSKPEMERGGRGETEIGVDRIDPSPYQPRLFMDDVSIEELAASISESGLLQPVVVRPKGNGRYELVGGHRRLEAVKRLGWEKIPVRVVDMNEESAAAAAVSENLQREDLSPVELSLSFRKYMERFGMSAREFADRIGKSESYVSRVLSITGTSEAVSSRLAESGVRDLLVLSKTASYARRVEKSGKSEAKILSDIDELVDAYRNGGRKDFDALLKKLDGNGEAPKKRVVVRRKGTIVTVKIDISEDPDGAIEEAIAEMRAAASS